MGPQVTRPHPRDTTQSPPTRDNDGDRHSHRVTDQGFILNRFSLGQGIYGWGAELAISVLPGSLGLDMPTILGTQPICSSIQGRSLPGDHQGGCGGLVHADFQHAAAGVPGKGDSLVSTGCGGCFAVWST